MICDEFFSHRSGATLVFPKGHNTGGLKLLAWVIFQSRPHMITPVKHDSGIMGHWIMGCWMDTRKSVCFAILGSWLKGDAEVEAGEKVSPSCLTLI